MVPKRQRLPANADRFLVCGLGSLGQQCAAILKEFGVIVSAIDQHVIEDWEVPQLSEQLVDLWVGDCRRTEVLIQAQVQHCRSILLVSSDERVNVEAAFAARLLNPQVRLVVRSAKHNLNQLLDQQLGNFVAFEPTQLSAPAFALAALGANSSISLAQDEFYEGEILGFFNIENELCRVIRRQLQERDRWCNVRRIHELNSRTRRVISHSPSVKEGLGELQGPSPQGDLFHNWDPEAILQAGDVVITLERTQESPHQRRALKASSSTTPQVREGNRQPRYLRSIWRAIQRALSHWRQSSFQHQIQRIVVLCLLTVLMLWCLGTLLFRLNYPNLNLLDAFYATAVLLLGGYGDLFSDFQLTVPIPWWLRLFGLSLTLIGTAFVGVLYALLTQRLLALRLQFSANRPPLPQQDHVIVIGMGRVGQRVVTLLQELNQPLVGVASEAIASQISSQIPLVIGSVAKALNQVNLAAAKSVVAVTEDELENLEMGLMAHAQNPHCGLALRTYDGRFTDKVAKLFPYAQVLCASALSAEAFVAAAFGENVLSLFRINRQTILVTEYQIEGTDTLHGLLLADVAYGFGLVPLSHQRLGQTQPTFMPSDDLQLRVGDRLIVLATIDSLQRVERGEPAERSWHIQVEKVWTRDATFNGANEIARITGCRLDLARSLMENLPGVLPFPLYHHQALGLVRRLNRLQVQAYAVPKSP